MDPEIQDPGNDPTNAGANKSAPPQSPWPLIRRILRLSYPYKRSIIAVFVLGAIVAVNRYLRAWLLQPLLDDALVPASAGAIEFADLMQVLSQVGILGGLTLIAQPASGLGRSYYASWITARVRQDIDIAVAHKFLNAPLRVFREVSSGDLLARSMADAQIACLAIQLVYKELILNLQVLLGGVTMMLFISWQLTLVSLIAVPPFSLVMSYFTSKLLAVVTRRQESQGDLSQRLIAILTGIKVIKAFGGEGVEQSAFNRESVKFFRRHMKVMLNGAIIKATGEAMYPTVGALVIGIGGWLVVQNMWGLTIGNLMAFALILVTIYKPISNLTRFFPRLFEHAGSAERLFTILDMEEEIADRPNARPMVGLSKSIRFNDVHFDYGKGAVLSGIDLEVEAGEVIAVVGRTGEGKSTLVDLVLRFHDPTRGSIEIDGVDLRDLKRSSFLDHVAVVTQDPFLFDETIIENIRYGRPDASDEEVHAAATAASAHDFISALPKGYETLAGEFGLRLSGGQRQRITIARAILANPAILVFDEATSALDAQTERAVQAAIEKMRGQRTVFLIAHRLSTIERADRIVVLDGGRVAETGDHASLLAHGGIYSEWVDVQGARAN
ncbi:MAG: ABC transporter ATP-binding protein [bacterium]|nr:hypothetical protein [Deltaproteobacteria bacterium]MCP4907212.1 ABC transporter ATP-binding protein [bacterium]